jgi:quinol monooxygenase YgiN
MPTLMLLVRMKAKAGREAELERDIAPLQERTRGEPGCLHYTIGRSVDDPASFAISEIWASKEDLARHMALPHLQALFARLPGLLEGDTQISTFAPLEPS